MVWLGTQRTVYTTVASAFAPPARRTSTAAMAAKNTKRFRLFNMIRSLFIEPPLSGQWEIVVLRPADFSTGGRAFCLTTKALVSQGNLSVQSVLSTKALLHLSSSKIAPRGEAELATDVIWGKIIFCAGL